MMATGVVRDNHPPGDVARAGEHVLSRELMSRDPQVDPSEDPGTNVDPSEESDDRTSAQVDPSEGPGAAVDPSEGPGRNLDPSERPGLTGPDPWDE
jgi:hypothetical protein